MYIYIHIHLSDIFWLVWRSFYLFIIESCPNCIFSCSSKEAWSLEKSGGGRAQSMTKIQATTFQRLPFNIFFTSYAPSKTTRLTAKRLKVWSFHTELAIFQKVSWANQLFQTEVWSIRDLWIFRYLGLGQVFSFPNPEVLVIFRLEHPKFDTTSDY